MALPLPCTGDVRNISMIVLLYMLGFGTLALVSSERHVRSAVTQAFNGTATNR